MKLPNITPSRSLLIGIVLSVLFTLSTRAQTSTRYPLIPYPASLTAADGELVITPSTRIVLPAPSLFSKEAATLNQFFFNSFGKPLKTGKATGRPFIELKFDNSIPADEGYALLITPQQMVLSARTAAGMFMAVQTIRQLLPARVEESGLPPVLQLTLPALTIRDTPVYAWRGMHLDVSRHFFSLDYLRKFIDVMALYKFNKFHLHLTDDQGWRIEIKKYPKLTEAGAWRTFNNQDSACMVKAKDNPDFIIDPTHIIQKDGKTLYGGFYTQAEMRALVAYAAGKHIDIIPEIDMPGHMMAAINQYPWLSCDGSSVFGKLFSTPICPCLPTTFQFAKDIYSEIMDIFPSTYIHIGGDEVDRSGWAKSDACKALMQNEGLKNTAELQSYFINEMEKFFNSKGRKMIGWDEILEGGVSKTAIIMYWRGWVPKAPIEAAQHGNQVIMTPGNPLYFDAIPDKNSLPNVYQWNPIPKGLTDAQGKNIIGAQANIWTEMIPSEARADYMYMPRMTALAEVLWSPHRDYDSYLRRLRTHFDRLDTLQVHYRLPDMPGIITSHVFTDQDTLWIPKPLESLTIRYTTDNTAPTANSSILDAPLLIRQPQLIRVAAFRPNGSRGDIYNLQYQQQALAEPATSTGTLAGLTCSQYKGSFKATTAMPGGPTASPNGTTTMPTGTTTMPAGATVLPDTTVIVSSVDVPSALEAPSFGLQYRGYLDIPEDGIYSFYLTCDDGGLLKIADRVVVDNDGNHAPLEKNGQVALKKGLQSFALDFVEGGGGYTLRLKYSVKGSEPKEVPTEWLRHAAPAAESSAGQASAAPTSTASTSNPRHPAAATAIGRASAAVTSTRPSSAAPRSLAPPRPYGVLPTPRQLAWHEMEMYCLIHFGVDTYTDKEWGYGDEDPALVNPVDFDAAQIVGAAKAGGFKGVVIVAKHHDGLCIWPTKTTEHNITKSPWKNGKGDMIKEYRLACDRLGMKMGLYCSPWDRNNAQYGTPAYVKTYRAQIKELYTQYGPLFMSWHDGANGGDGYYGGTRETRKIDRTSYYGWDTTWAMIRQLQPGAAIFGDIGPDVRWVGNEEGHAGTTCWATYTPRAPEPGKKPANGYSNYWEATEGTRDGQYWLPAECDVPLRPGWFYHATQDQQVKSPYQLLELYYQSVGRGADLDLGIAPNQQGRLDQRDVASLKAFGDLLQQTFSVNLAKGATLTASNIRGGSPAKYGPSHLVDNDRYSYWATDDDSTQPQLLVDLGKVTTFNVIRLRENIKLGQRIHSFTIEAFEDGQWLPIGAGTSIGANRLIRLPQNVVAAKVRLSITGSGACIALSDFGLFKEPAHLVAPAITRDNKGLISITTSAPVAAIRYTLDGKEPGINSPSYRMPFQLPEGGLIKARSFEANNQASEVTTHSFGLSKEGWKVMVPAGAGRAIDDNPSTLWNTLQKDTTSSFPQDIAVDMGKTQPIKAFTYLPRQDKKTDGIADRYIFYTSEDGANWQEAARGEFANIRSNPLEQLVALSHSVSCRYFKFSITHVVSGNGVTVAEVGVNVQ